MKKTDKKSSFGMLSVKAGIDNNPNPTQADKIAGAKMKTKKAKKGKMFRNGGNVLIPFIDYKSIAGMGRTKPKKKKEEIKEKNEKVSAIVPKPKPYTSKDLSKTKPKSDASKSFAAPPVELNPRYMDPDARASYGSGDYPKKDTKKSRQRGAPTFPATMTVPGATASIMKQTGTEGKKAKKARIRQENIKYLKDYESGRRQRAYESRIATADFFGSIFGDNSKRKSLADVLTGKKQGGLGVKMAKGGFKKKTPIY
jgi:hypothetical protein